MNSEPLKAGERIEKRLSEPGDVHSDGAPGRIRSVLGPDREGNFGYLIVWDDLPGVNVFIAGHRVRRIEEAQAAAQ